MGTIVIAEFPDREAVRRWYASPEYAEGLKIRARSGLHRKMICVEGATDASPDKLLAAGNRQPTEKWRLGPAGVQDFYLRARLWGGALLTKDERRILSWADDDTVPLWAVHQIGPAMNHGNTVFGALVSADGPKHPVIITQ
jgi:Domain of unknown function (DUF1330)